MDWKISVNINMTMELILLLLTVKHAFVDLFLQSLHHNMKKRNYFGGWPHYTEHAVATFVVVIWFTSFPFCILIALLDGVLHWHIDYTKHVVQTKWNITPTNNKQLYWCIQAVDQSLHFITYFRLVLLIP